MERPGFEADRFRIVLRDLAVRHAREVLPRTGTARRTALFFSPDGKTIYTTADDVGQVPLFAIESPTRQGDASWSARGPFARRSCTAPHRAGDRIVFGRDTCARRSSSTHGARRRRPYGA